MRAGSLFSVVCCCGGDWLEVVRDATRQGKGGLVIVTCRLEFQALAGASRAERFLSCSSLTNATLVGWLHHDKKSRTPKRGSGQTPEFEHETKVIRLLNNKQFKL
jgi:hypothetical protein